jgi:hypothetical protein
LSSLMNNVLNEFRVFVVMTRLPSVNLRPPRQQYAPEWRVSRSGISDAGKAPPVPGFSAVAREAGAEHPAHAQFAILGIRANKVPSALNDVGLVE